MLTFEGKDILSTHKQLLKGFWDKYGNPDSKKMASPLPKTEVMAGLQEMGEIYLNYNSSHDRQNFEERKHQKQFTGFNKCFACKEPAQVRHHIIWLSHGGRNQKNNIVGLCRACHAELHPWLKDAEEYMVNKGFKIIFNRTSRGEPAYITMRYEEMKIHLNVMDVPALICYLGAFMDNREKQP